MKLRALISLFLFAFLIIEGSSVLHSKPTPNSHEILKVGNPLPNAILSRYQKEDIRLNETKGKVKILSIVPQLNTPVCDEQTHRFSEDKGDLDQHVQLITISTNSAKDQDLFAKKTNIKNMLFLSDRPHFDFGERTGLLNSSFGFLRRTVIIADENNIIRYIDFVPGGGLPKIKKALRAAQNIVEGQL